MGIVSSKTLPFARFLQRMKVAAVGFGDLLGDGRERPGAPAPLFGASRLAATHEGIEDILGEAFGDSHAVIGKPDCRRPAPNLEAYEYLCAFGVVADGIIGEVLYYSAEAVSIQHNKYFFFGDVELVGEFGSL